MAVRSPNAASIWVSMALSASPKRPISVRLVAGSTLRVRSPPAIAAAVSPIRSSGRSSRRTIRRPTRATASRTPAPIVASSTTSCPRMESMPVSGMATTT